MATIIHNDDINYQVIGVFVATQDKISEHCEKIRTYLNSVLEAVKCINIPVEYGGVNVSKEYIEAIKENLEDILANKFEIDRLEDISRKLVAMEPYLEKKK